MSFTAKKVYELLPAIYRLRDSEQGDQLKALLSVIAEQVGVLEEDLERLYDNLFIETCEEWVVPYIGDLVGVRGLSEFSNARFSQRAQVANTIAYRRRKGTAAMLEQLARDVTNWPASVVEDVRTAVCEKCVQSPVPTVNPSRRNAPTTTSLVAVSTFWSAATWETPIRFTAVNTATMAQATTCAPVIEPDGSAAREGKK